MAFSSRAARGAQGAVGFEERDDRGADATGVGFEHRRQRGAILRQGLQDRIVARQHAGAPAQRIDLLANPFVEDPRAEGEVRLTVREGGGIVRAGNEDIREPENREQEPEQEDQQAGPQAAKAKERHGGFEGR